MMKEGITRKALQYLLVNPDFNIHKINKGALRYSPNQRPVMLGNGQKSYGRLEMFELLPEEYMRNFVYVGWRDFTAADQHLYDIAMFRGGVTEL